MRDKAQQGPVPFFTAMFGIVPLAAALLVSIKGFNGRIDIDMDAQVVQPELLPDAFASSADDVNPRQVLIDAHVVHLSPEGVGHRKPRQPEKTAQHSIDGH